MSLQPAVPNALASAYERVSNDWLTQDTTNPTGKGPVRTGPVEPISDPRNGTAAVDLNAFPGGWDPGPELAADQPDYFAESAFPHAGPWPSLPEAGDGKEPFGTLPDDGITPKGYYKIPPKVSGLGARSTRCQGHDRHSQATDTAGWEQYTPTGRQPATNHYLEYGHHGVDNFWPVTEENVAIRPQAVGGNQSIGGVVAEYGGLQNSGGNTPWEPASPAPVMALQTAPAATTIPQWGF